MKNIFLIIISLLILNTGCEKGLDRLISEEKPEASGNEQGNGVDNLPRDYYDAWFSGDILVRYCAIIDPNFGANPSLVVSQLQKAFEIWAKYIADKKINEDFLSDTENQFTDYPEKAKDLLVFTKSEFLKTCNGTEDIVFYFGLETPLVSSLKKSQVNPTAFAHKLISAEKTGRGKGFVWIAKAGSISTVGLSNYPDWAKQNHLLGVLLHEIGHIYGNSHTDGTIMDPHLDLDLTLDYTDDSNWSGLETGARSRRLSQIDSQKELVIREFNKDDRYFTGYPSLLVNDTCRNAANCTPEFDHGKYDAEMRENFKILTGSEAIGDIRSTYHDGKIFLTDSISKYEFNLNLDVSSSSTLTGTRPFRRGREWEREMISFFTEARSGSSILMGSTITHDGSNIVVSIEQNVHTPLAIYYFYQGKRRALLVMETIRL